jgi:hypothetical protein
LGRLKGNTVKERNIPSWQVIGVGILSGIVLETIFYSLLFGINNIEYMFAFGFCTIPELLFSVAGAMIGKYKSESWTSVWAGAILGAFIGYIVVYLVLIKIPLYL